MKQFALSVSALCQREMLKFIRDRSRLVGALLQPLGFWILLGLGFHGSFQMPTGTGEVGYLEFLFPGIVILVLLFTAIFSTISIVEERKEGFLQAALIAPTSRVALVFGNSLGGTLLATAEAFLFLMLLPLIGIFLLPTGLLLAVAICFLTGLAFTALGFIIAWRMDSTRGFHAVMNMFLLPLWFLSGGPFPLDGVSPILSWIMAVNPVTYAVDGLRQAMYLPTEAPLTVLPLEYSFSIVFLSAIAMVAVAVYTVRQPIFGSAT